MWRRSSPGNRPGECYKSAHFHSTGRTIRRAFMS